MRLLGPVSEGLVTCANGCEDAGSSETCIVAAYIYRLQTIGIVLWDQLQQNQKISTVRSAIYSGLYEKYCRSMETWPLVELYVYHLKKGSDLINMRGNLLAF
jgi:hypothetical protein